MSSLMQTPPAKSEFKLSAIFEKNSENKVSDYFSEKAIFSNSWVGLFALVLIELKEQRGKSKIILARHSCYEFTKAILIADLEPCYIDINDDLTMKHQDLDRFTDSDVLAVISVNNCGVENCNENIKNYCNSNDVVFIEDATYTFLGKNNNSFFGYMGDIAILNFSEGKFIPVGGGAVIFNNPKFKSTLYNAKSKIKKLKKESNISELLSLIKYKLGSISIFYTFYKYFLKISNIDLKKLYSMEPTRNDKKLNSILLNMKQINGIKFSVINDILINKSKYNFPRKKNVARYRAMLKSKENFRFIELPPNGIFIKQPILCSNNINEKKLIEHERLGIKKLYSEKSELYGSNKYKVSNTVYKNLITLPVHEKVTKKIINEVARALDEICN